MPRDLFGDVTRPFAGTGARSRFTVPLSLAAHTCVLAAVVVVPLLATSALPALQSRIVYADYTPVLPPPPPPPSPPSPLRPDPPGNPNAAPYEAPSGFTKEPTEPIEPFDHGPNVGLFDGGIKGGVDVLAPPPPPPLPTPEPPKTVRVGVVKAPAKVHDAAPTYPAIAQAARVEGVVIIQATIGTDGRVVDATVLRSVPLLDVAAIEAVRQWRYTPSTLNGQPVAVVMTVTVNFTLR
jgi:periplasmic protein TonB